MESILVVVMVYGCLTSQRILSAFPLVLAAQIQLMVKMDLAFHESAQDAPASSWKLPPVILCRVIVVVGYH